MAFLGKARTPSSLTFPKNAKATTAPPQILESFGLVCLFLSLPRRQVGSQ
ncbi:hypothetical protein [Helicobacter sp.]|nr:hypothetical protein [Helicobacter sp.]MBR2494941.1 hypothetical protein [Helicobacter sp.]